MGHAMIPPRVHETFKKCIFSLLTVSFMFLRTLELECLPNCRVVISYTTCCLVVWCMTAARRSLDKLTEFCSKTTGIFSSLPPCRLCRALGAKIAKFLSHTRPADWQFDAWLRRDAHSTNWPDFVQKQLEFLVCSSVDCHAQLWEPKLQSFYLIDQILFKNNWNF